MIVRLRTIELRREGDDPATAASTVLIDWQHRMDTSKLGRPPASEPTPHDIRAFTADFVLTQHAVRAADLDGNLQAVEDLVTAIELRRKALREHSRQGQPIENYFVHLQPFVQAAIDELVRRAASKQAIREELRRLFVVLKRLEGVVFREIPDPSDSERNVRLGSLQVDSTKGPLDASEGRHDDFFGTKASVKVYPYSVEGGFDQGQLQLSILELTRSRIKQVEFLAEIYGNRLHRSDETDATDKVRAELAQLDGRGFDLHSDSDWREYLLKRLHEHRQTGATDEVAYRDLVETVRIYFATFAVHSPYNIEDFGDSYIDRDFRARCPASSSTIAGSTPCAWPICCRWCARSSASRSTSCGCRSTSPW
ncbi:hypothetical protein OV079_39190 [Nannocystis pusilla]|uniref:Uncharacterized protein n=1 Tax=Nannocystis pusilla TaxID=889268 RepID=A0A9X3J0B4_9BACT|nr:hypothetical protein [Nannocystis pusilla]MCY1011487.1 hypothetical protein [Nannocystis pusilla]